MSFKISDKVVCVDDVPRKGKWSHQYPNGVVKNGEVYSVYGIQMIQFVDVTELRLLIVGMPCIGRKTGKEIGFAAWRFRRLDEIRAENAARSTRRTRVPLHQPVDD